MSTKQLFILADGGSFHDLALRFQSEGRKKSLDLLTLPEGIITALRAEGVEAECPLPHRFLFLAGTSSGHNFAEKMSAEWKVQDYRLSECSYSRETRDTLYQSTPTKVRMHAQIGYAVGGIAAAAAANQRQADTLIVVCSEEAHLVSVLAHARALGLDARLGWLAGMQYTETAYCAARNQVPEVRIPWGDHGTLSTNPPSGKSSLDRLVSLMTTT